MIGAIVEIIFGIVIWQLVPEWITEGDKNVRNAIKLICNIVGVILLLVGCYSLVMSLFGV